MTHPFLTAAGVIVAASFVDLSLGVVGALASDVYSAMRRLNRKAQR